MKKIILIFAIVIVMIVCISCDRQKKTNKSDRFPGFAQLGSIGEWSKLYIDLNSAKKDGFIVTFKFIRVVEGGYVIQDGITDCRNTFQSLDGVQYKDDGTSDRKYPGDAAPISYQNRPGIAELVKAACNKTGMPAIPAPEAVPAPTPPEAPLAAAPEVPENQIIEPLENENIQSTSLQEKPGYYVIGTCSKDKNAILTESEQLNKEGYLTIVGYSSNWSNFRPGFYMVVYGIYDSINEAKNKKMELDKNKIFDYIKHSGKKQN